MIETGSTHVERVVDTSHDSPPTSDVLSTLEAPSTTEEFSQRQVRTTSGSRFTPDALIAAAAGVLLGVIGLIVIVRGGFSGPMSTPVVNVLGFTHTTTSGLIEIGLGASLLIAGALRSRAGALFSGGVLGVAGFVGAVTTKSFHRSLALETPMAWLAVVLGAVVVLAALALPRFSRSSSTVKREHS